MNANDAARLLIGLAEQYLELAERFLKVDWDSAKKQPLRGFELIPESRERLRIGFFFPETPEAGRDLLLKLRWAQLAHAASFNPYREPLTEGDIEEAAARRKESEEVFVMAKAAVEHSLWPHLTEVQHEILRQVYFASPAQVV